MRLSIDDVKEIVNKVTNGGGNYTQLEAELARMVLKYRETIGRLDAENSEMFNALYSVYNNINSEMFNDLYSVYNKINSVKCASELRNMKEKTK